MSMLCLTESRVTPLNVGCTVGLDSEGFNMRLGGVHGKGDAGNSFFQLEANSGGVETREIYDGTPVQKVRDSKRAMWVNQDRMRSKYLKMVITGKE